MATPEELERARQARLKAMPTVDKARYANLEKQWAIAEQTGEIPEGTNKDEWFAARIQRAAR